MTIDPSAIITLACHHKNGINKQGGVEWQLWDVLLLLGRRLTLGLTSGRSLFSGGLFASSLFPSPVHRGGKLGMGIHKMVILVLTAH